MLRNFSLICMLCYDIYVKKTIVEQLVDKLNADKEKES